MSDANRRTRSAAASDWLASGSSSLDQSEDSLLAFSGWKRQCLFGVLVSLTVVVLINLSLTLWLVRSMRFHSEGLGSVKITSSGIHVNGEAVILDSLSTSRISSSKGRPLVMDSSHNITLTARDSQGRIANQLHLGEDRLQVQANEFRILNSKQETIFAANEKEVIVGPELLTVSGTGGSVFHGSVETPLVRAEPGHDLRLESITRSLQLHGPLGISMESRVGSIRATSLDDIQLQTSRGAVRLESANIVMPNLKTAPLFPRRKNEDHGTIRTFQVCVCSNGHLFLSLPDGVCVASSDLCS